MRIPLIFVLLFSLSSFAIAEENWQKWVHQKSEEIQKKQAVEHIAQCNYLRVILKNAIDDVSKKWTCCSEAQTIIDYAITSIDAYQDGACFWDDMNDANASNEVYRSLMPIRDDLVLLRQYTPECR